MYSMLMKLSVNRKQLLSAAPLLTILSVLIAGLIFSVSAEHSTGINAVPEVSDQIQPADISEDSNSNDEEQSSNPTQTPMSSNVPSSTSGRVEPSCKNIPIPRQTEYRDDPYTPAGETKKIHEGVDGFVLTCTEYDIRGVLITKEIANVKPVNNIMSRGTGKTALQLQQEAAIEEQREEQRAAEDKARRDQAYAVNLAQCRRKLGAHGIDSSNVERMCRQAVHY